MQIDGSYGEGGGQILRMAAVFSALLKIPIEIINIRAGRPKPGLAPQHLHGLRLVRDITRGQLIGDSIGSTSVKFSPSQIVHGHFEVDPGTAGSITLLLQVAIPILIHAPGRSTLLLRGGTDVTHAPTIDFLKQVLIFYFPELSVKILCKKRGFYPRGGGEVQVEINPIESLAPVEKTKFGFLKNIRGSTFVSGSLPSKLAREIADSAETYLRQYLGNKTDLYLESNREPNAFGNGIGCLLIAESTENCRLFASIPDSGKASHSKFLGKQAAEKLVKEIQCQAAVDSHVQDELIVFMSLAKGTSKILCGTISDHTEAAIYVAEKMLGVKFKISALKNNLNIIECAGIGYMRERFYSDFDAPYELKSSDL